MPPPLPPRAQGRRRLVRPCCLRCLCRLGKHAEHKVSISSSCIAYAHRWQCVKPKARRCTYCASAHKTVRSPLLLVLYLIFQCVAIPQRFIKRVNTLLDLSVRVLDDEDAEADQTGLAGRVRACLAVMYAWLRKNKAPRPSQEDLSGSINATLQRLCESQQGMLDVARFRANLAALPLEEPDEDSESEDSVAVADDDEDPGEGPS